MFPFLFQEIVFMGREQIVGGFNKWVTQPSILNHLEP